VLDGGVGVAAPLDHGGGQAPQQLVLGEDDAVSQRRRLGRGHVVDEGGVVAQRVEVVVAVLSVIDGVVGAAGAEEAVEAVVVGGDVVLHRVDLGGSLPRGEQGGPLGVGEREGVCGVVDVVGGGQQRPVFLVLRLLGRLVGGDDGVGPRLGGVADERL